MSMMGMRWGRLYRGTPAEHSIEEAVAALGVPYRTQFPGYLFGCRFFPDLVLPTLGLVIEVDDPSHEELEKMEADAERTAEIGRLFGWKVVRCTNEEALEDPHGAVRRMLKSASLWPLPSRLPSLAAALPEKKKCPQKIKREAKAGARRRQRMKGKE